MCGICSSNTPIHFYINQVGQYLMSSEPHTKEGMMLFMGLDDQKFDELMGYDEFKSAFEASGLV